MDFRQAGISGLCGILYGMPLLLTLSKSAEAGYGYSARFSAPVYLRQQSFYHPYSRPVLRETVRRSTGRVAGFNYLTPILRRAPVSAMQTRRWIRKARPVLRVRDATHFRPDRRLTGEEPELKKDSEPSVITDVHAQFRPLESRKKTYEDVYGKEQQVPPIGYAPPTGYPPPTSYPVVPYYPLPPMPIPYGRWW